MIDGDDVRFLVRVAVGAACAVLAAIGIAFTAGALAGVAMLGFRIAGG